MSRAISFAVSASSPSDVSYYILCCERLVSLRCLVLYPSLRASRLPPMSRAISFAASVSSPSDVSRYILRYERFVSLRCLALYPSLRASRLPPMSRAISFAASVSDVFSASEAYLRGALSSQSLGDLRPLLLSVILSYHTAKVITFSSPPNKSPYFFARPRLHPHPSPPPPLLRPSLLPSALHPSSALG